MHKTITGTPVVEVGDWVTFNALGATQREKVLDCLWRKATQEDVYVVFFRGFGQLLLTNEDILALTPAAEYTGWDGGKWVGPTEEADLDTIKEIEKEI